MKKNISYPYSLCWLRRDLRLYNNKALAEATGNSHSVLLAFVFDTKILNALPSKKDPRVVFIYQSLKEINTQLKKRGSRLFVMYGDPKKEIPNLCRKLPVSAVFVNEDYESYSKQRDSFIKHKLSKMSVSFYSFKDHVIFKGLEIQKKDGSPYRVFSPYKKAWLKQLNKKDTKTYITHFHSFVSCELFKKHFLNWSLKKIGFQPVKQNLSSGESAARQSLKKFAKKIHNYHKVRDYPYSKGTSELSVHLRFGTLSIRDCVSLSLKSKTKGAQAWLSELIWRDFYQMILDQYPYVEKKAFLKKYQKIKWPYSKTWFQAWCKGQTGYPLIDAGMRQLNQTGYISNRVRMITASFLVKDLLTDWRKGEAYFAEKLLDFDKAANNGGWQWCAGTGCDAQPYFRIFHPVTQSKKFDPKGSYIRQWVPELKTLSEKCIHFPKDFQKELPKNFQLGKHYPFPIVDHKIQKEKVVQLFSKYR